MSLTITSIKLRDRRRRSKRLALHVPVLVCGRGADNSPFREGTGTLSVNACGGLLTLRATVQLEQTVLLQNNKTHEVRECRVAYIGQEQDDKRQVAIEFMHPAPYFWRIHFLMVEPRVSANGAEPVRRATSGGAISRSAGSTSQPGVADGLQESHLGTLQHLVQEGTPARGPL